MYHVAIANEFSVVHRTLTGQNQQMYNQEHCCFVVKAHLQQLSQQGAPDGLKRGRPVQVRRCPATVI